MIYRIIYRNLLVWLLVFRLFPVFGINTSVEYSFTRIDINQGLSHNQVHCIFKDSKGFIWIGTNSGLNQYDGYDFRIFRHIPNDSTSLSDNRIQSIFEDHSGKLWISTMDSYVVYDPATEKFSRDNELLHKNIEIPISVISRIRQDNKGNIWFISDQHGLYIYRIEADSIMHLERNPADSFSIHNQTISSVAVDSEGNFWTVGFYGILEELDGKTFRVVYRNRVLQQRNPAWRDLHLFIDRDDDLWIYSGSSDEGISLFDAKSRTFIHFHQNSARYRLNNNIVNCVAQDDAGIIWVGTDHGGINLIDKSDFSIRILQNNPDDSRSLSHNSITTLYKDNEGIIWIGTYKKGICYYHENLYKFKLYRHQPNNPKSLPYEDVNAFQEDVRGNLWIGTNGGGLIYFDRVNNTFKSFKHNEADRTSLSHDVIVSMCYDHEKILWIGTYYGGLNRYDGKTFQHFRNNPADRNSLANDRVWVVFEDSQKNLWIGTLGGGLDLFDRKTQTFKHFRNGEAKSVHSDFILHMTEDRMGNIWIGTANGADCYDPHKQIFSHYSNNPADRNSISHNVVTSILADSRGLIWLATQEGLNIFDPESNSIYRYYIDDGLPDNSPLALLEDNDGLIWISTISGITNIRIGDRVESGRYKLEFASFNESDGLQGKEFNEGIAYKTTRGELIFGGPNGFNIFNPSDLTYNTKPPDILITGLQIFNRTIRTGQKVNGRIILSNAITETSEIVLKHFEDVVSIEFAALNYIHPEKNRYEYILEGFNREWMQAGANERKATYTNLDPGEYVFRVKGSNNDGIWNTNGKSLKIIVKPSIWKTKAAIISYFILLLTALILLRYMILLKERIRVQIDQERQEARRRHELDLLKIRFFTNVSHEFRTPLSLILAPLEKLLKKGGNGNEEERSQYKLMYRNSRRLLNLVNQLLDFRRMEVQKISLRPAYGDIVIFINEIFQTFTDLAERKRITFTYTTSHNEFFTWFDHDKVEKIIFNLLSNAFKFTPEGEKIGIDLHIEPAKKNLGQHEDPKSEQDRVKVKVCDTGIGIPAENINRIFDRFFQNDVPDSMINQGSGIGLSLTKEFVQLHNGTIEVESEPGKGSCFTVTLLLSAVALGTTQGQDDLSESITLLPEEEEIDIKPVTNGKKALVLLIEDNDDFRFYLKDNLKGRYSIIEACDGKEGIAKAIGNLPDLIVSDIMMPEVDGIELCRQVKSNPNTSHIPIILLTARMSEQKKLKGFETGADDYITKPFSFEMLESRMNNLIEQRERIRNSFQQHFKIEPGEIGITSLDEKLIEKALKLVENNMSNSDFSVEKLSRELGMSRVHLYKKLTSLTGKTPIEFIRTMRLKRAAQLLGKSQLTVSEIAYEVGFNDPRYFSKYFKTEFGVLPSQYGNSKKTSQN